MIKYIGIGRYTKIMGRITEDWAICKTKNSNFPNVEFSKYDYDIMWQKGEVDKPYSDLPEIKPNWSNH